MALRASPCENVFDSDGWTISFDVGDVHTVLRINSCNAKKGPDEDHTFCGRKYLSLDGIFGKVFLFVFAVCKSVFVRLCICICECEYRAEGEGGQLKMRECGGDRLAREVTLPGRRNSQIWSTIPANIWRTIPDTFLEENSGEEEVILLGR